MRPSRSPAYDGRRSSISSSNSFSYEYPRPLYLRALHPFHADANHGERSSCLTLVVNAIIFVHSIHSSGWADGTLLTGQRGWFPSTYCEPYTLDVLRPLLDARDALDYAVCHELTAEYNSRVSCIVDSVRSLLKDTGCLTRNDPLVQQSDLVRRERKSWISKLSKFVNLAKDDAIDLSAKGPGLLYWADRIYLCGGRFIDAIGPLSGLYRAECAKLHSVEVTPSPPISYDFSTPTIDEVDDDAERDDHERGIASLSIGQVPDPILPEANISAAKQLQNSHDDLLSHLAALIGGLCSDAQTQTASRILLATRQCVNVARAMLATLEAICNFHPDTALNITKDCLYTEITNLITSAHTVVTLQHDVVYDTRMLKSAAIDIVKGSGECKSRAQHLLETLGDFTVEGPEADVHEKSPAISRDDTSSSLASLVDRRQSQDVIAQVKALEIPYKKVAPLIARKDNGQETTALVAATQGREEPGEKSLPPSPPAESRMEAVAHGKDTEMAFNGEGQIIGATLCSLVAYMTPHDHVPEAHFCSVFFQTFRIFSSAKAITEELRTRFEETIERSASDATWDSTHGKPIRLRVYNVFKIWLECYWRREEDTDALPTIEDFAKGPLASKLPQASARLLTLTSTCNQEDRGISVLRMGRHNSSIREDDTKPVPLPLITKAQLHLLKSATRSDHSEDTSRHVCSIVDFDDLEIARQLTLYESKLFCAITPVELIGQEFAKKKGVSRAVNIKAMSAASTDLASWVADSILWETEQKRRTAVLKHWIKIAVQCAQLNNYNTLMAILCALNSSTIARLKRTWDGLSRSHKTQLEHLRTLTDHHRNYAAYRSRIKSASLPCLPYLGLYRTDLTFVDEGNPNYRPCKHTERSLINFDKHYKTCKIVSEIQSFQVPYNFAEIPELTAWIVSCCLRMRKSATDLSGNLWRRSLVIEPKLPTIMKRELSVTSSTESESWSNKLNFLSNRS